MKKTLQIFRGISISKESEQFISEQLKEGYTNCTGIFIVPVSGSLKNVTLSVKIAQYEVLPQGTDAILIAFDGQNPLSESIYDFKNEGIPARSSEMDISIQNTSSSDVKFNLYLVLENL